MFWVWINEYVSCPRWWGAKNASIQSNTKIFSSYVQFVVAAIPIQHSTMLQSNPKMRKLPRHLFRFIAGHAILHDALLLPIFAILPFPLPPTLLQRGVFTVQSLREGEEEEDSVNRLSVGVCNARSPTMFFCHRSRTMLLRKCPRRCQKQLVLYSGIICVGNAF